MSRLRRFLQQPLSAVLALFALYFLHRIVPFFRRIDRLSSDLNVAVFGPAILVIATVLSCLVVVGAAGVLLSARWGRILLGGSLSASSVAALALALFLGSWAMPDLASELAVAFVLALAAAVYLLPIAIEAPREKGTA